MKIIYTSNNSKILVDDEDFDYLNQFVWYLNNGYARTYSPIRQYMHRLVLKVDGFIDHINSNKLDNRKNNLREASYKDNNGNRTKNINGTSQYKGVIWDKSKKKWKAQITKNSKANFLGRFDSELDAAKAYNEAALKYFGEFAKIR